MATGTFGSRFLFDQIVGQSFAALHAELPLGASYPKHSSRQCFAGPTMLVWLGGISSRSSSIET